MQLSAGILLKSTALLKDDPHFGDTLIYLTEYNEQGAMGFVINKIFPRKFNELIEFMNSPAFPLWMGGPVSTDQLYFIHRYPGRIQDGSPVADGIFSGGDFATAVRLLNAQEIDEAGIRMFIGYCGWDRGELEAEVEEGSWELRAYRNELFPA
ncbi:MAG: YqgE/AlgH family protein [Ferruginibacter sp.]